MSANVECLNPFVYRKFLGKEANIGAYHVVIIPYRRHLEGSEKTSKELLAKFGFEDTNTSLVNMIEAIQNQTNGEASATKEDVFTFLLWWKRLTKKVIKNLNSNFIRIWRS